MREAAVAFKEVALGDICEFRYGKSLRAADRDGAGFPVYGSNGVVGYHSNALTSGPTIIVGRKGSFGEVHLSDGPCWPIDTTYFVDAEATGVDLSWLAYSMSQLDLTSLNRAAAVPGLRREDAYRKRLLLPSRDEQRRIVQALDTAGALRAQARLVLARLGLLIESFFEDLFGEPVSNPLGWQMRTVGDVATAQGGLQVAATRANNPIETPYLRVANVHRNRLNLDEIKPMRVTAAELARCALEPGDLLVVEGHGNTDEIGRAALWDGSIPGCVHQNHLIRARFDPEQVLPIYGASYVNSPGGRRHLLRSAKTTSGLNTITVSDVRRTPIAVPPLRSSEISPSK